MRADRRDDDIYRVTTGQPAARQPSTRRLFAVYAAVSLVPVLILGLVLSGLMERQGNSAGLRQGRSEALLVARSTIAPLLEGHDLRRALDRDEMFRLDKDV